jgi:hypothetical protein
MMTMPFNDPARWYETNPLGINAPPPVIYIGRPPESSTPDMGKQRDRNWGKGRGDDPFWDLSPSELRDIENDPNSTPDEKARARKIRKYEKEGLLLRTCHT